MAFTKTPGTSTYQTKKINLMKEVNSRASGFSKDIDFLNVFFEPTKNRLTGEDEYAMFCRPGVVNFSDVLQSTNIRQVYYWESRAKYYVWVDDDLMIINGTTGSTEATITGVLGTSSGDVGVTEFLYDDGTVKLVFTDGTSLKTIDSANTVAASASPDLPSSMDTNIVFLDGYLFVIDGVTYDIYNSDLNDPLLWTAGNYISAEMLPDPLIRIAKLNNYIVAFGSSSIEYFWDAAEESGSPLNRTDTPIKYNGFIGGLASLGNKLFFIGNSTESIPSVFVLEDFKIKELANESLRRQLEAATSNYLDYQGHIMSVNGHSFYFLSAGAYTYAIDVETGLWTRWAFAGAQNFLVFYTANAKTANAYFPVFYMYNQSRLMKLDSTVCTDVGTAYSWQVVTDIETFDSYNQKTMNRLSLVCDRPAVNTTMTVQWTDDDYSSYNTGVTVNLRQEMPAIYRLGRFRRRAFKLSCTPELPFRLRHLEVDINLGNS